MIESASPTPVKPARSKRPPQGRLMHWLPLPLIVFLIAALGFPLVANLYYSVTDLTFENLRNPAFNGLANYADVLQDPTFWGALGFSLKFAVIAASVQVALGFIFALAFQPILNRFKPLLALVLLPMMISPALMAIMYRLILNDFVGVVPQYMQRLGLPSWTCSGLSG